MIKIAYIELDTHAEIAGNFMELMRGSQTFEVHYYFSNKISKQIDLQNTKIILSSSETILKQLLAGSYDLVILGTVHRYFNVFQAITEKFNTSVIIHNVNFSKNSPFQLFLNIFKKDLKYRLKLLVKENLLHAPKIYIKANNLLVLDENLRDNNLKYLPVFYNKFSKKTINENFTVVIPGAVSQKRRNYKKVLQKLKDLKQYSSEKIIQVVFLGKAQEKELAWLKSFEALAIKDISILYFTEKVPQNTFDKWMQKADVLWCPIQNETEFFSQKEVYGKSKMSGNIGDAIKYGKTAFFPEDYYSSFPFICKSNSLEDILKAKPGSFSDFQVEFNKEKIAAQLEEKLKGLL